MPDKAELQDNVTKARTKAQNAAAKMQEARDRDPRPELRNAEYDALDLHYRRAIAELEDAINAAGVTEYE